MDHPNQNTMLLPASYAVISEEEMTYLDGGQSIYLGSAFNHDIYFNTDQFATFCQNAASEGFSWRKLLSDKIVPGMGSNSGGSGFLGLSGIKARHGVHDLIVDACNGTNDVHDLRIDIDTGQTGNAHRSDTAPGVHLIPGVIEGAGQAQTIRQTGLHTACDVPEGIVDGAQHRAVAAGFAQRRQCCPECALRHLSQHLFAKKRSHPCPEGRAAGRTV